MAIDRIEISGYRSIRSLRLDLGRVTIIAGANGAGKTNIYRALYLTWAAASGTLAATLAREGGMPSVMWAGARTRGPRRMAIEVTGDGVHYLLECGLVPTSPEDPTAFCLDPDVKKEEVRAIDGRHRVPLLDRAGTSAWLRDADGVRVTFPLQIDASESILSQLSEPHRFPVLSILRSRLMAWRFYHHFATDETAAIRAPQVGVRTGALAHDGRDLAAALQTILEIGDADALHQCIDQAFPGAQLVIKYDTQARFEVTMGMPGVERPLQAAELSDGTLRYLCLVAALLSPRPPAFLVLNEPETSLHPDLFAPLAGLLHRASKTTQLVITTHAETLCAHLSKLARTKPVLLTKTDGETTLDDGDDQHDDDD
ncbi:MAG: AAA family ATPase [Deltaproteobacteria bacterium]|nr:AAA family ATPase [Deltaproteobacteria bacterium]